MEKQRASSQRRTEHLVMVRAVSGHTGTIGRTEIWCLKEGIRLNWS